MDADHDLEQLGCTKHAQFREQADLLAAAMGLDAPDEVGVVTLFLYFYEGIMRKMGKHGIEFLFKSAAKDLVRQRGVFSEKALRKLSWAAKDVKLNDQELKAMIETSARRVGRARTLKKLLQEQEISVEVWLNTFEPRASNNDRYPDETDDMFGTSVLTLVRKKKEWMGHPHFAPSLAFIMNERWAIAAESRDSKAQLNNDFSMYGSAQEYKRQGKSTRRMAIESWLKKIHKVQQPSTCVLAPRKETMGLDMVEQLKAHMQCWDLNSVEGC